MGDAKSCPDLHQLTVGIDVYERHPSGAGYLAQLKHHLGIPHIAVVATTDTGAQYRIEKGLKTTSCPGRAENMESYSKGKCGIVRISEDGARHLQKSPWLLAKSWRDDTAPIRLKTVLRAVADDLQDCRPGNEEATVEALLDLPSPIPAEALHCGPVRNTMLLLVCWAVAMATVAPASLIAPAVVAQMFLLLLLETNRGRRLKRVLGWCVVILLLLMYLASALTAAWASVGWSADEGPRKLRSPKQFNQQVREP